MKRHVERKTLRSISVRVQLSVFLAVALSLVRPLAAGPLPPAAFDFAVYATGTGCGALTLSGQTSIDSFDSSEGTYAQTKQLSKAVIGSAGNINLSGGTVVNGPVFVANSGTGTCVNGSSGISMSGQGTFTGGAFQFTTIPAMPAPDPVTAGSQDQILSANTSLLPGNYGNVAMSGGKTLTLVPGTYNVNSLTFSGGSLLAISAAGQVFINIAGSNVSKPLDLSGGSIVNPSGKPINLQISYGGSLPLTVSGGAGSYAVVYAPNSAVSLSGGADWYGALTTRTFNSGGSKLHYDRSLPIPPTITASPAPAANAAGWNNTNASVTFTCADPILGIASCSPPVQFTTEGANQTASGTAVNRAGFSSSTSATVNIDKTSPLISTSKSPAANAAGWNNSDVTVTFTCSDALSGIASCPAPVIVSTEAAANIQGMAIDVADNSSIGGILVKLDKTPPALTITSPSNGSTVYVSPVTVAGTIADAVSGLASLTCNGQPARITGSNFSCVISLANGPNTIAIAALDIAGNSVSPNLALNFVPTPTVKFNSPVNLGYLNLSPTTVTGTVSDPAATLTINSISVPNTNGTFSASIPLAEGPNILTATATSTGGGVGSASITVTLDTTPPHVSITSPPDQFVTSDASIAVAGSINDIVVGTVNSEQATVTVNGGPATVANRTFLAASVPLSNGTNLISVVGRDRAGNAATAQITVVRQTAAQPQIRLISGDNQSGVIGSLLPAPLVVGLTDASGNPVPNKQVIFKVSANNGSLTANGSTGTSAVVTTDAQGQAQARWTLGGRAGAGGNSVQAYVVGFAGTALFTASGTLGPAGKIVIDTGNGQIGEINQPLAKPLIVIVVDSGNNRLGNVPVTFTVSQGGGNIGGLASYTVNSDSDGRAAATLTLGFQEGNNNNVVQANFPNNAGLAAAFAESGRAPGNPANTAIKGVVLDNSNLPIPGVTIRAALTNLLNSNSNTIQSSAMAQSDAQGQFTISPAPVGFVKLLVDGSTAQRPGIYPTLDYDLVTVAGQNYALPQPVYLLPLNTQNQLCVSDATGGGTLTVPEAPGFSLTFGPGQVTFPGGSKTGCVSVTVVHSDKVPMAPGFGQQPRFIVTIQPAGATFNPPAPITLPNVDGLKPRQVTEMYSFDHDIGSFVAIGTGVVSDDGSVIRSSKGVGVLKAGWHCGGDPNTAGTVADCAVCQICDGAECVADPSQNGTPVSSNKCQVCMDGSPEDKPLGDSQDISFTYGLPSDAIEKINQALAPLRAFGVAAEINGNQIEGKAQLEPCCEKATGNIDQKIDGSVTGTLGGFTINWKVYPPGPFPELKVQIDAGVFGIEIFSLTADAIFKGGIFLNLKGTAGGQIGYRKDPCSEDANDKAGCFYANAKATLTPSLTAQVGGSADVKYDCFFCTPATIKVEATMFFGNLAWPLDFDAFTYNDKTCSTGFQGGRFAPQAGTFDVSVNFKGSYQPDGQASKSIDYTRKFLSCKIDLSASPAVTCN
jgi:hypothetical protein